VGTPGSGVPPGWAAQPGRPGIAVLDPISAAAADQVAAAIEAVRRPGDVVVVSVHWGGNWGLAIPPEHRAFGRRLIDLGAAHVVHGHSSHHPLPVEVHRGHAILYGCGDLLNDYEGIAPYGRLRCDVGALYLLDLDPAGGLQRLEIVPTRLRRLRLERADASAREWLREIFGEGGRALGTAVQQQPDGHFLLRWQ